MKIKKLSKYCPIITELFCDLDNRNYLDKRSAININIHKIILRMKYTNTILSKFRKIHMTKLNEYIFANKKWFSGNDISIIFSDMMTYFILSNYELTGILLQFALKPTIKHNKIIIEHKKILPIGSLCERFYQIFHKEHYKKFLNLEFRNALAHSKYWFENGNSYYYKNNLTDIKIITQQNIVNEFNKQQNILLSIQNECKNRNLSISRIF